MSTALSQYHDEIRNKLKEILGERNVMAYPRLSKVVLNMGVGQAINDKKLLEFSMSDLEKIAGQKPIQRKSRKSEAGFKMRQGWPIGCMVTLRKRKMLDFCYSLVNVVLPKVRDFKGLSPKSFDGRGNFNMGLKEQIVFSQIQYDKIDQLRGLNITFVTTAQNDNDCKALMQALGCPFIGEKEAV